MRRSLLSLAVASILLGGCSLIPDYQRPASPVDSLWPSEAGGAQTATAAADLDWRAFFKDPALQGLIDTALANNRDLRVAALNVQAYAAQRQIQRSALFPSVTADGGATRQRLPGSLSSSGEPSISSSTAPPSAPAGSWTCSAACAASTSRPCSSTSPPRRRVAPRRSPW